VHAVWSLLYQVNSSRGTPAPRALRIPRPDHPDEARTADRPARSSTVDQTIKAIEAQVGR
jgi:hypothetical protein